MPPLHLRDETGRDIPDVERAALLRHDRMKQHLEEHITELFLHLPIVAVADRLVQLVRLLDEIGAKRVVRLRGIPLAARAQVAHESERIFKC